MRIVVTGGMGFIGSNFIRLLVRERPDWTIVNLDKLTYAGNPENLTGVVEAAQSRGRYSFVRGDIADGFRVGEVLGRGCDAIVNFAAESHVDRSIDSAASFVQTNVVGTEVLLDAARRAQVGRFLHVSTDEVYGDLEPEDPPFTETTPLRPSSPYSATKAGADHLALAYQRTYGLHVVITRCSNNYGPYQFPEKLIPLMIANALEDKALPVYGDGMQIRDWLYVDDHCRAIRAVLERGRAGEIYNVGGSKDLPNIDVVRKILAATGKPESLIRYVQDRPGHDRRYAITSEKLLAETGWAPQMEFEQGLAETVRWYQQNSGWVERVRSGAYRQYYESNYAARLAADGD